MPPTITDQNVTATHGNASNALAPGTTYEYQVRAINDAVVGGDATAGDEGEIGPWSSTASARTDAVTPGAPVLTAIAGGDDPWVLDVNSITVKWNAPVDDGGVLNDGGSPITSYQLQVRTGNAEFQDPDRADEENTGNTTISNLPGNRLEYTHSGLKAMTGYYYRIRALNNADGDSRPGEEATDTGQIGEISLWSAASTVATTSDATLGTFQAPGNLEAAMVADQGQLTVSWDLAEPRTGVTNISPVIRYEIQFIQRDISTDVNDNAADDLAALNAAEQAGSAAILIPTPPSNITYPHTGLPGGTRYVYRVRAINAAGSSPWSAPPVAMSTDERDPDAPILTATAVGATEILLEWNVPAGNGTAITGFFIQQWDDSANPAAWGTANLLGIDNNDEVALDDEPERTVYTVSSLDAGETFYYRIRAIWSGQDPGDGWSATTKDDAASASTASGVPGQPTLTNPDDAQNADADDVGEITLNITAPTTGGSDLTGYELQRYENGQWNTITAPATDAETFTDKGLTPGVKYYYAMRASNSSGTGAWSNVEDGVATAGNPDPPTLTATATGETTIRLTWNVPANNGTPITGYELERRNAGNDAWEEIDGFAATDTVTEFIDTGRMPGQTYSYRIRALEQPIDTDDDVDTEEGWSAEEDADGEKPPKGSVSATTHGDVPEAPALVLGTGNNAPTASSITIMWTEDDDTGGSAITKFEVYKWVGSSWVHKTDRPANAEDYMDKGLEAGTKHYYIVRAVNSQGPGKWSTFVSGSTTAARADAPVLTATTRDTTSIQLTWTEPALNGQEDNFDGYVLQRWNDTTYATIRVDDTELVLTTSTTLFVDTGLEPGTQYWYQIKVDADDPTTQDSVYSAAATATTVAAVPDRPELTRPIADADITHNSITLKWTAPDSNGSDIIHYEVQMWNATTRSWTRLAVIAAAHLTYKHQNLTPETRYVYRVRAQNRAPADSGFGSWSTIIAATTDKAPE